MEDNVKKQPEKNFIKVRGTATFYEGNAFEFVSQKDGQPELDENDKPKITYNHNALTQYMHH
jgi:hypothetical protein